MIHITNFNQNLWNYYSVNIKFESSGMKSLKITDVVVISLFIVGISLGIIHKFDNEVMAENDIVETNSQPANTIDPAG